MRPSTASQMTIPGVHLIRSKRRTLSLEIREDLEIQVRAPSWIAVRDIASFVDSRKAWIAKALSEIRRRIAVLSEDGKDGFYWNGQICPVFRNEESDQRFGLVGDSFLVHPLWINEVEKVAEAWFRKQASMILEKRLSELAKAADVTYRRFRLGGARTRWGSCSHSGTITLHWRLVWTPEWVRDYVVFHELCHLRHFNHSRAFWLTLAQWVPDYRRACGWLKEHAGMLTLRLSCPASLLENRNET